MSKKYSGSNKKQDECPVCGGVIWGRGQKVIIEGARMTVCDNCAQHGTRVKKSPKSSKSITRTSYTSGQIKKTSMPKPKTIISTQTLDEDIEIVPDFAKKIRNVRNAKGLNQDQSGLEQIDEQVQLSHIETELIDTEYQRFIPGINVWRVFFKDHLNGNVEILKKMYSRTYQTALNLYAAATEFLICASAGIGVGGLLVKIYEAGEPK